MVNKKSGERCFFEYAFPVIRYCGHGDFTENEISNFEKILIFGEAPSRQKLEELFPNAVKHLKSWSLENVRDYWLRKHNEIVRDNPLCKVYLVEVSDVLPPKSKEVCIVKIGKNMGIEAGSYINLKVGDKVTIHAFQVAEKLSKRDIKKYFRE